jgi:drug/metabolite transporter (DMT)-like permease
MPRASTRKVATGMNLSNYSIGYAAATASAVFSAAMFAIGKWVVTGLSPIHLIALIFSIATILMGAWLTVSRRWHEIAQCSLTGWILVLIFCAFSIGALITMWTGIQHLDPTVAAFLSRLEVIVAVILGVSFLRERFRLMEGIGGLIVFVGLVVLRVTFDVEMSLWFWVMIASAVLFGATEFVAKITVRHLAPIPLTFLRDLIVALFFLILTISKHIPLLEVGPYWWGIIATAILGPALGRVFYLLALKYIEISKAALITQTKPLFVAVIALIALNMIPTPRQWIGGVLIIIGCALTIGGGRTTPNRRNQYTITRNPDL